jgi:hypothetical protein
MVGASIGDWITNVLRAVSGDVTSTIGTVTNLLNAGYSSTSSLSRKKMQLVEWQTPNPDNEHFPSCLVAIKSEEKEMVKRADLKKVIGRKSSAKSARAQVFWIQAGNDVARRELIGLKINFVSITNYYSFNFEQERVETATNERGSTDETMNKHERLMCHTSINSVKCII